MRNFLKDLLNYIYKEKCYFCNSSKECLKMCSKCYSELEHGDIGVACLIEGVEVYNCGEYAGKLQKLIRGVKYHRQRALAYYQAKFMWEYFEQIGLECDFEVIPVPLFKLGEKKRGYNHMVFVCEEFCRLSGFESNYEVLKRIKDTKPQYKLTKQERRINLVDAFSVDVTKLHGAKKVLIIDDILTTGSTFEAIIKEFKKNNINTITCLSTSSPRV